jgi:hypothetical protein
MVNMKGVLHDTHPLPLTGTKIFLALIYLLSEYKISNYNAFNIYFIYI